MNKTIVIVLFFCLMACQQKDSGSIEDTSEVVATVGEYEVTKAYLSAYLASQGLRQASTEQTAKALDDVVKQLALVEQARKMTLELSIDQQLMLEQAKHRSLAQAAIKKHLADHPVTEADMQAEYERITAELQGEEYHVRHLLFQDEAQAIQVLDKIKTGDDYLKEEATYLQANPQGRNVGDIGWVNIMQVPEVFREPLKIMTVDSVHPQTLVSQYGVHVLYLDDKRPLDAPGFEAVKVGVKQTLEQRKIDRYQQLAVIKSKVKVIRGK